MRHHVALSAALPALVAIIGLVGGGGGALAKDRSLGQLEYETHCAVCHGADGTGNGPMAPYLKAQLPDLSQLQKTNKGVFPFDRVYSMIDGTQDWVKGHGDRDMPIWGRRYAAQAADELGEYYNPVEREGFVRGRILALIEHLYKLQK